MRKTTLKLTAVRINGERFFQVISPRPGGGRLRQTFKDQGDAERQFKLAEKQIAGYGAAAMLISDRLRLAAIEADRLLQPYGKTIVDAAQCYAAHLKAISARAMVLMRPFTVQRIFYYYFGCVVSLTCLASCLRCRNARGLSMRIASDHWRPVPGVNPEGISSI